MSGSDFPSICLQMYTVFFEKTNKITTNYQNLELSDPWRPYMACCPKRNLDFWRNHWRPWIHLYIGRFRAPLPRFGPVRNVAGWSGLQPVSRSLCPVSGLHGVQAPSGSLMIRERAGNAPSLTPCNHRQPLPATATRDHPITTTRDPRR